MAGQVIHRPMGDRRLSTRAPDFLLKPSHRSSRGQWIASTNITAAAAAAERKQLSRAIASILRYRPAPRPKGRGGENRNRDGRRRS